MPTRYAKIIQLLESRSIMPESPPSLAPMREAFGRVLPSKNFCPEQTIVVAGTNGKGSVCAALEALFLAAGETVGLYTSPHLQQTTERIRINGATISEDLFCTAYEQVDILTHDLYLTHFEILTLMAGWLFYSHCTRLDRFIFEVGLGGTWDATNAIPHQHCVITSIGYDHENLLGNTLTSIARNKFGIIGPDSLVVHSPFPEEVQTLVAEMRTDQDSARPENWIPSVPFQVQVEMQKPGTPIFYQNPVGPNAPGPPRQSIRPKRRDCAHTFSCPGL